MPQHSLGLFKSVPHGDLGSWSQGGEKAGLRCAMAAHRRAWALEASTSSLALQAAGRSPQVRQHGGAVCRGEDHAGPGESLHQGLCNPQRVSPRAMLVLRWDPCECSACSCTHIHTHPCSYRHTHTKMGHLVVRREMAHHTGRARGQLLVSPQVHSCLLPAPGPVQSCLPAGPGLRNQLH